MVPSHAGRRYACDWEHQHCQQKDGVQHVRQIILAKRGRNALCGWVLRPKPRRTGRKDVPGRGVQNAVRFRLSPFQEAVDPDSCHVFALYQLFASPIDIATLKARYLAGGMGYGEAKTCLFECVRDTFLSSKQRFDDLMKDPSHIDSILEKGAQKARKVAQHHLSTIREAIGISS